MEYEQVQAALALTESSISASEMHGLVCGCICNQQHVGVEQNLERLLSAGDGPDNEAFSPLRDLASQLMQQTRIDLDQAQSDFDLLLPTDDVSIEVRTEAIADWCRGFIVSLTAAGAVDIDQLPDDVREVARDMITISDASADDGEPEDNERALVEVQEYVRVGVQLIFETLGSRGPRTPEKLH